MSCATLCPNASTRGSTLFSRLLPVIARRALGRLCVALRLPLLLVALSGLAACASLEPVPLAPEELEAATTADAEAMQTGVEPLAGPLSLHEAMARALKYNLDRRVKMLEEALALRQFDASRFDLLPQLMAQAGYNWRNNDLIRQSRNAEDGTPSPSRFLSSERANALTSLNFTWSLLDLGLSYYGARQEADRALIAMERRRKAMHLLMQDVRSAYWRAAAAQQLREDVQRTARMAEEVLADSRKAEFERVRAPLDTLRYQRGLLENLRDLEAIEQELASAQIELASLINAPLDQPFTLADGDLGSLQAAGTALDIPLPRLEDTVLANNADLREAHYDSRIARTEVRRAFVRLFPNLSLNWSVQHDTDTFLLNSTWQQAGTQLAFNLLNLLSGPARIDMAKAGVAVADQRRVMVQLAALTQMHLARLELANARARCHRADSIYDVDAKIADMTENLHAAQTQSRLDVVSAYTASILSRLQRYQALAELQTAESQLIASLGLEPELGSVDELSLGALTEALRLQADPWTQLSAEISP